MTEPIRILMCAPDHYDVDYVINPWMEGNIHKSSRDKAVEQWSKLNFVLNEIAQVDLVQAQKGVPDMVFTANAGLVLGENAVLSRFYHPERQGEEPYFKQWFEDLLKVREMPYLTVKGDGYGLAMVFVLN
jgi:N-dimethylarginine dimethylaminohydrolase